MKRSRSPPHLVPVRLVRSIHLSYAHYIISAYDLCLGVIPLLFSIEAGISTCSQFARTDSCLLLRRRQSENIEPAHSAERQHHQHNSDSSEKVLEEQSLRPTFYFSSNIWRQKKYCPAWGGGSTGIWMNGINGNPCCHLLLKDGILKQATEWLIMPMCFLEVILIGVVRVKLLFFYHLTKLSLYWHCRSDT